MWVGSCCKRKTSTVCGFVASVPVLRGALGTGKCAGIWPSCRQERGIRCHLRNRGNDGDDAATPPRKGIADAAPAFVAVGLAQVLLFLPQSQLSDLAYMLVMATATLFIGSTRLPLKKTIDELDIELNLSQAVYAPIVLTCALVGVFFATNSVDMQSFLRLETTALGALSLKDVLDPLFYEMLPRSVQPRATESIFAGIVAAIVALLYMGRLEPTFFFNNILAFGIASRNIKLFSPTSFLVVALLLLGLLLFDTYWVFTTDVLLHVTLAIDSPTEFLFPKGGTMASGVTSITRLGFGDVIIPGIFTAQMLNVDRQMVVQKTPDDDVQRSSMVGPYFSASVIGYVLSLCGCFSVSVATQRAQPALLYIVPCLLGSALFTASRRGELRDLLSFETKGTDPAP